MKRIIPLILMLLLLVAPALLPAATFWDNASGPLNQMLSVVMMIFGVPLLIKLGKKMGITIDEQLATDAINALINILVNIDLGEKGAVSGESKKKLAVLMANNQLTNAQKDVLVKKYGTIEAAVQVAFERSSLAKPKAGK